MNARLPVGIAAAWLLATAALADDCRNDLVQIRGPWGQAQFSVEIADTPQARARGLMERQLLPRGAGMLFVYDSPQPAAFWMKNTLIALDMLFADESGRVTKVHHMAQPGDLSTIDGGRAVRAVLEIGGGLARRYGIEAGSDLRHPVFAGAPAAWPC